MDCKHYGKLADEEFCFLNGIYPACQGSMGKCGMPGNIQFQAYAAGSSLGKLDSILEEAQKDGRPLKERMRVLAQQTGELAEDLRRINSQFK